MKRILAMATVIVLLLTLLCGCGETIEINLGGEDSGVSGEDVSGENGESGANKKPDGKTDEGSDNSDSGTESGEEGGEESQAPVVVDNRTPSEKYADAAATYDNVKGWISIPNTYVDYAVVQYNDNSYYLDKNLAGAYNWYGSIFAYSGNSVESAGSLNQNTIFFGHNKADGLMFGNLTKYENASWAQSHSTITTIINGEELTWQVVAAMDCETSFNYLQTSLSDSMLNEISNRSYITPSIGYSSGDRFLTLSTCTYKYKLASGKYREDVRFVVVAKLTDSVPTYSANGSRVAPTFAD